MVAVNRHEAVSLVVSGLGGIGAVDRDLVVVGTQTMTVGVRVGEQATLSGCERWRKKIKTVGGIEKGGGNIYIMCVKVVEWLSCYILRIRRTLLHSLVCNIASYYMYMLTSIIILSITTIAACLFSHKVPSNLVFECTGSN